MANLSAAELRELLDRDLPGAVVPPSAPTPEADGAAAHAPKGKEAPADLLATGDTVVAAEQIPAVARYLRDRLGYEYLSNITAVDYLREGLFELVYHFYHLGGGRALVVKVRVPRDAPEVPSITPFWPGAALQEREAFDMYGVTFPGHPDLRRVYMWDEFAGFPMRKDFPKQGDKYLDDE